MDVVYNYTGTTIESNFNQLVPGYYYRHNKNGKLSDATACGVTAQTTHSAPASSS